MVSSLGTGTFLVFFLVVVSRIPLAQLLFQIVVLLNEVFHGHGEGLYLSLKSRRVWFVSLNVVSNRHWLSKYHATLYPGSVCYDLQIYYKVAPHRQSQLMMPKYHRWATHQCGAGQIPSEGQVRTSHNSRVLEMGKLCVPWFARVLKLL